MTSAGIPPAPPAAPAAEANLATKAKLFMLACAGLTTIATASINGYVSYHTSIAQADDATRKADVRKLEEQFQQFTGLTRVFITSVNAEEPSKTAREAVAVNVQQQYDFLGTLEPLLSTSEQRILLNNYRQSLIEMNKSLRDASNPRSAMAFARSVSHGIDARLALIHALRKAAGMPVVEPAPDATELSNDFARI